MSDEQGGGGAKGIGAVIAAVLAAGGIAVARGADNCATIACRAGSHADSLATHGDDLARLGRAGGSSSDELVGLGRHGGTLAEDDLARFGIHAGEESTATRLSEAVVEAATEEVTYEVVEWAVEDDGDDGEDAEDEPSTHPGGRVTVESASRLVVHLTVREPRMLVWVPAGSTIDDSSFRSPRVTTRDVSEAVTDAALAHLDDEPEARPLLIAGVTRDDGRSLTLGGDRTAPVNRIHRRCWDLGRSCLVLACTAIGGADAGDTCLAEAADLLTAITESRDRPRDAATFLTRLLALRRASPAASQLSISRTTIDHGTPRIILSRQN